jgi:cell division protein FtsZ
MGGGTGTGAASVIARVARELGILTVGVVTKPFLFEGARRARIAEAGVAELRNYVDTLIVIPNQNLFRIASEKTTFSEAFVMADQVLYSGVACIVDLILKDGLINLDFADVRTVMTGMGTAMMGTGEASGERRATVAAEEAISNPLLDDVSLRGAKGLLLSITGGPGLTLYEVDEAASRVRMEVDPEANIIVGATYDPALGDRIRVSIVASGMSRAGEAERAPPAPAENWVRGTRAVAAGPDRAGAPRPAAAGGGFIPVDPRDHRGGAQDLQQRLTAALQHAPPGSPTRGSGPAPDTSRGRNTESWRGPGNVVIEDGPPQLQGATPPPLPQGYATAYDQGTFAPQPPSEVRRQAPRRPHEADEYLPAAEYGHRPPEGSHAEGPPPHQPASRGYPQQHPEPRRRMGLFERITGRVRGASDSDTRQRDMYDPYAQDVRGDAASRGEHPGREHHPHPVNQHENHSQDAQIPVFFRERRK